MENIVIKPFRIIECNIETKLLSIIFFHSDMSNFFYLLSVEFICWCDFSLIGL